MRLLSPPAIVARLDHSLTLLAGGARDLPTRQQTLRGAIAWSHEMLDAPEKRLFACCSVFAGRADLEAVEEVCEGPDVDVLEGLSSLVDKSLVRRRDTEDGEPRFTMFGTIRAFAAEQLADTGSTHDMRARHAHHYVGLVARLASSVEAGEREALDHLERDHDDLRAAMAWALERGEDAVASGLVAGLWRFWQKRGYLVEGRHQAERVVTSLGPDAPDDLLTPALDALGGLEYWLGDQDVAQQAYQRVLDIRRRQGDPRAIAQALYNLSFTYVFREDQATGALLLDEAARLLDGVDDGQALGGVLWAPRQPRVDHRWAGPGQRGARDYRARPSRCSSGPGDRFHDRLGRVHRRHQRLRGSATGTTRVDGSRRALRLFRDSVTLSGYTLVLDSVAAQLLLTAR